MNMVDMTHAPHVAAFEELDWISHRMLFAGQGAGEARERRGLMLLERAAHRTHRDFGVRLGDVESDDHGEFARVWINGVECGHLWREPGMEQWDCELFVDREARNGVECMSAMCAIRSAMHRRGWTFAAGVGAGIAESLSGLSRQARRAIG